jgi:hypothetical protein
MTDLNNKVFELAIEELDQVTGGADLLTAFLTGFAKGLGEPLRLRLRREEAVALIVRMVAAFIYFSGFSSHRHGRGTGQRGKCHRGGFRNRFWPSCQAANCTLMSSSAAASVL